MATLPVYDGQLEQIYQSVMRQAQIVGRAAPPLFADEDDEGFVGTQHPEPRRGTAPPTRRGPKGRRTTETASSTDESAF